MKDEYTVTDIEEVNGIEDGFSGSSNEAIICSYTKTGKGKIDGEEVDILASIAYSYNNEVYWRYVTIVRPVNYVGAKGVGEEVEEWLDKLENEITIEDVDKTEYTHTL